MLTDQEYKKIKQILYKYISNETQLEDSLQNALLRAYEYSKTRTIENLTQFIIKSAANDFTRDTHRAYNKYRDWNTQDREFLYLTHLTPEKILLEKDEYATIKQAINSLSEKERHGLNFLYKKNKLDYGK